MNIARGSKVASCVNLVAEEYSNSDPAIQVCVYVNPVTSDAINSAYRALRTSREPFFSCLSLESC
jgi:hypothetical protein